MFPTHLYIFPLTPQHLEWTLTNLHQLSFISNRFSSVDLIVSVHDVSCFLILISLYHLTVGSPVNSTESLPASLTSSPRLSECSCHRKHDLFSCNCLIPPPHTRWQNDKDHPLQPNCMHTHTHRHTCTHTHVQTHIHTAHTHTHNKHTDTPLPSP